MVAIRSEVMAEAILHILTVPFPIIEGGGIASYKTEVKAASLNGEATIVIDGGKRHTAIKGVVPDGGKARGETDAV